MEQPERGSLIAIVAYGATYNIQSTEDKNIFVEVLE
jgi:hypothetical protein